MTPDIYQQTAADMPTESSWWFLLVRCLSALVLVAIGVDSMLDWVL